MRPVQPVYGVSLVLFRTQIATTSDLLGYSIRSIVVVIARQRSEFVWCLMIWQTSELRNLQISCSFFTPMTVPIRLQKQLQ